MRIHLFVSFVKSLGHGQNGQDSEAECCSKDISRLERADTELCCTVQVKKTLGSAMETVKCLSEVYPEGNAFCRSRMLPRTVGLNQ